MILPIEQYRSFWRTRRKRKEQRSKGRRRKKRRGRKRNKRMSKGKRVRTVLRRLKRLVGRASR